jgi:hypothetical protein
MTELCNTEIVANAVALFVALPQRSEKPCRIRNIIVRQTGTDLAGG